VQNRTVQSTVRRQLTADPTPDPHASGYLKRPDAKGHLKVLEVLRRWDPIGVSDLAPDEYDSYSPGVVQMLDNGIGSIDLKLWLVDLARGHMGLDFVDEAHTQDCAEELIAFWSSWRGV